MSNVQFLEIFRESKDSISTTPAARKRMKKRYKLRLLKLSTLENLFRIDMEMSKLKLGYRDYTLDANDYTLFPILEKWLLSQRPEDRIKIIYWTGDLKSILKAVGITPKQFILCHIDLCKQNLVDLREVKIRFKREFKDSRKKSEEILPTKTNVVSENRPDETENSKLY
jgi:hypothetical protein